MEGRQAENNILPVLPGERAKIQGLRLTERAAAEDKKGSPNRRFGGVLGPLVAGDKGPRDLEARTTPQQTNSIDKGTN